MVELTGIVSEIERIISHKYCFRYDGWISISILIDRIKNEIIKPIVIMTL